MISTAAAVTLFVKTLPYMIGLKIAGGIIDVGVHWVKIKMSKGVGASGEWKQVH